MEASLSEKLIQSENLLMSEFNPFPFSLINYTFGLVLSRLICCFLDSMAICMFYCSYSLGRGGVGSFFFFFTSFGLTEFITYFILLSSSLKLFFQWLHVNGLPDEYFKKIKSEHYCQHCPHLTS